MIRFSENIIITDELSAKEAKNTPQTDIQKLEFPEILLWIQFFCCFKMDKIHFSE